MTAELIIDDEATYLADIAYSEAIGRQAPATDAAVAAAAPRIVAVELRRLAAGMTVVLSDDPRPFDAGYKFRGDEVAQWLNRRADELDPPAGTAETRKD